MRTSAGGIGLHPDLEALLRRGDPQVDQFIEALQITRSDVRQRKDQWNAADSLTGLQVLDHGVRLAETVQTLIPERAPHTSYFTDLELDGRFPFTCPVVEWAGAEPAQIEIKRVKAWLHPRRNPANPQTVVKWRLDLLRIVKVGFPLGFPPKRQLVCAPIADPVYATVQGSAEGLVTFDYSIAPVLARPRPKQYGTPQFLELLATLFNAVPAPVTLLVFTGLDKDNAPATNIGLGYDNTVPSVTTNGNVLSSRKLVAPPQSVFTMVPLLEPGTHGDDGAGAGTPRLVIEYGTYANDDLTFSGAGNRLDLNGVPTNPVVFTINGAVPNGTALTGQVLKDGGNPATPGDWRTFLSGQDNTQLTDVGLRQTYEIRALFFTDASASLTPVLRTLGAEEIRTNPAYDAGGHSVARIQLSGGYGIDLLTLQGEVVDGMLLGLLDGERDYHSWIENLLADADLRAYTFRLWVGAASLSEDKWLHIDDFLPKGQHPRASDYAIPVVSVLTLIRGLLPKKSPGASSAPDGDVSVGGYTTDTGSGVNLYQRVNEVDADDATYVQSAVDPVNAIHKESLPTPADLPGRRLYVDYRIRKDVAAGKTIDATIELRHSSGTLIATSTLQANISDLITPGSFQLSDASVAAITDPANLELWITFNVGGAGGSRRGILTWWRFRTEDRRQSVSYVNQSVKAVYDDLLANQLEVDVRYRGPGLEDTTTLIGKAISEVTDDEEPTGKDELEAVAHVVGFGLLGSQGKLKAVNMKDAGEFCFVWPMEEIRILSITQGIEDRIDTYVVPFNWNAARGQFDDEWEGASAVGVLAYGKAKNAPLERLPQEIAEWIPPQPIADYAVLARSVGTRVLDWFATGRGRALIETSYMFPELEPGDSGVFETDMLVVRDPHTGATLRGRLWLSAKIELCDDPNPCSGRRFTVAIRPLYDLGRGTAATRVFDPMLQSAELIWRGDHLFALWVGDSKVRSVKIATSTAGQPAAGTGTIAEGNTGEYDAGAFSYTQSVFLTITPYSGAGATGIQGEAKFVRNKLIYIGGLVDPNTGKLKRGQEFLDGKYALMAEDATGVTAEASVKLVPTNGVFEGGVSHRLYRHREEITVNGPDADGNVAGITFAQTYQNAPMILFKGGQYVSYSSTLPAGKQRLRLQAFDVTASGFSSRAQIVSVGATTARSADFASGSLLDAEGETADADLGSNVPANDDTYTVHYEVVVAADQEVSEPGSEVQVNLTVALETNDGGGWVERATYLYSAIANDSDPNVLNTWSHEQKPIVVSGLGANDDVRIRAKEFSVVTIGGSSGTGSFTVKPGDGAGSNPGAWNGVTWTTAADTTESAIPSTGDNVIWVAQEVL